MPINKVKGGYKWGNHGHVYPNRAGAVAQAAEAHANGYKGDEAPKKSKRKPKGALMVGMKK